MDECNELDRQINEKVSWVLIASSRITYNKSNSIISEEIRCLHHKNRLVFSHNDNCNITYRLDFQCDQDRFHQNIEKVIE